MPQSATRLLFLVLYPFLYRASRVGEVVIQLCYRDAGFGFLARPGEGHAELQEIVCCLDPLGVALVPLGERGGSLCVVAPRVISLPKPVLRASGQRIVRVLANKVFQSL